MTVRELVADWLKTHGYDGLWDEANECACLLDDLMPCDSVGACQAGYRQHHTGSGDDIGQECQCILEGEPCKCVGEHKPKER
jgi:hypothetical protein